MRYLFALFLVLFALPALAEEGLDIRSELQRPGVRLLAVEFYSTHCKPCMEAVPKWQALHDKYRDQGLRLVVVSVMDEQRCVNPGWRPDRAFCDEAGEIAGHMGVDALPAAFLWDWTGKLLVDRGQVEDVAHAIERELPKVQRVALSIQPGAPPASLVRAELLRAGKLDVIVSAQERVVLEQLRHESQRAGYADATQCRLGQELAANSVLKVSVTSGKDSRLFLHLLSAEKGCVVQVGVAPWQPARPEQAVAAAVEDLLQKLRSNLQMPGGLVAPVSPQQAGPGVTAGRATADEGAPRGPRVTAGRPTPAVGRLILKLTPRDAVVTVTGPERFRAQGNADWERADLKPGEYTLEATASHYLPVTRKIQVHADDLETVKIALERLGTLSVAGAPEGAKVVVTGPFATTGGLPLTVTDAPAGEYRVTVSKGGFEAETYAATVRVGDTARVAAALKPPGTLEIRGKPAGARLQVSGPNGFKLDEGLPAKIESAPRGTYEVHASRDGYAPVVRQVAVNAGEATVLELTLTRIEVATPTAPAVAPSWQARPGAPGGVVTREEANAAAASKGTFLDNGDGTVRQVDAGLVWMRGAGPGLMRFRDAEAFCAALKGQSGWRLPTIAELVRLRDQPPPRTEYGRNNRYGYINAAFADVLEGSFWSSSPAEGGDVWYTNLREAKLFVAPSEKFDAGHYGRAVKCVRSGGAEAVGQGPLDKAALAQTGEAVAGGAFRDLHDGVIFQVKAGLLWQHAHDHDVQWDVAKAYCANILPGGRGGWRLPTKNELAGLFKATHPKGQEIAGLSIGSGSYFSSTVANGGEEHWIVDFRYGETGRVTSSDAQRVLCVRGID